MRKNDPFFTLFFSKNVMRLNFYVCLTYVLFEDKIIEFDNNVVTYT